MIEQPSRVYPEYHKEGVRFQLYSDGTVMVWTKDLEPRELGKLSVSGEGRPWIPKHKNFNSLCRQWFREGDVDDLVSEQRRISDARGMKRKAGEDLYEALDDLLAAVERSVCEGSGPAQDKARAALAKARGE
ncbi:hypothetical protein [Halomonas caseinilytica]|uniref:hypothetical protein n=1 Tax=Halomonas caseinilytica TaxID=438744 RepID=UPI0007E5313A|nr:hypothetical protein [Halomonas caseinilytica]